MRKKTGWKNIRTGHLLSSFIILTLVSITSIFSGEGSLSLGDRSASRPHTAFSSKQVANRYFAGSPAPQEANSELRKLEFGVEQEWLEANRSTIVPIFISGGEAPGVNDYFGQVALELHKYGLFPVAVKNGIEGFTKEDLHNQLARLEPPVAGRMRGRKGALAGISRIDLLAKDELQRLRVTLNNMAGFHSLLAIGGGDHAVKWSHFAHDKSEDAEHVPDELKQFAQREVLSKMIVVYKTIDGDTHGQPMGFHAAATAAQDLIHSAAASAAAYNLPTVTVVRIMGADVGNLAVKAASRNPFNLPYLQRSMLSKNIERLDSINDHANSIAIVIPEVRLSLDELARGTQTILDEHGHATIVLAEGFEIQSDDSLVGELVLPDKETFDAYAQVAWMEMREPPLDPNGNIQRAKLNPEFLVRATIKHFTSAKSVRMAYINYPELRGGRSDYYERIYAASLARRVTELAISGEQHNGLLVSLPPDDMQIQELAISHFEQHGPELSSLLEGKVVDEVLAEGLLRVQTFEEVYAERRKYGLHDALLRWSPEELAEAGVLFPDNFEDTKATHREEIREKFAKSEMRAKSYERITTLKQPVNFTMSGERFERLFEGSRSELRVLLGLLDLHKGRLRLGINTGEWQPEPDSPLHAALEHPFIDTGTHSLHHHAPIIVFPTAPEASYKPTEHVPDYLAAEVRAYIVENGSNQGQFIAGLLLAQQLDRVPPHQILVIHSNDAMAMDLQGRFLQEYVMAAAALESSA